MKKVKNMTLEEIEDLILAKIASFENAIAECRDELATIAKVKTLLDAVDPAKPAKMRPLSEARVIPSKGKDLECPECGKKFKRNGWLVNHRRNEHQVDPLLAESSRTFAPEADAGPSTPIGKSILLVGIKPGNRLEILEAAHEEDDDCKVLYADTVQDIADSAAATVIITRFATGDLYSAVTKKYTKAQLYVVHDQQGAIDAAKKIARGRNGLLHA